jgi:hypothetical protein
MKKAVLGALLLSSLLAGRVARAQNIAEQINGSNFGNTGQVAIAGDFSISFLHANGTSSLVLSPAIDYFFMPHLSLGGQVTFAYASHDPGSSSSFGLAPRVGYNIPLAPMFSLYPRAGFSFTHVSVSPGGGTSASANLFGLFLFAPFLFHPVPHFFIGFGPSLSGDIAGGDSSDHFLTFGLESTVGGYFDW